MVVLGTEDLAECQVREGENVPKAQGLARKWLTVLQELDDVFAQP